MSRDEGGSRTAPTPDVCGLFSPGFLTLNFQFGLVTAIAALFFAFSGYLQSLGVNPAMAGFIISADALAALVVQPAITPLVHAGTASRWLAGGSLLLAAALFMVGHVTSVPLLVAARLLQGSGFICVLAALITKVVLFIPPEMSGRAFGWISLVRLVPYAVIPPLFDLFRIAPSSFGSILNIAAVAALIPLLILMLPLPRHAVQRDGHPVAGTTDMRASLRSPVVLMLLISVLLFFCGYSAVFFYLKQFGAHRGIADISLFFTIATVVMIAARLFGGWLFDRCSKVLLCGAGLFLASVSYLLLPFCIAGHMFLIPAFFAGLGWGIAMPLQAAVMFDISEPRVRGMNQNLLIVMMQGGFFVGPFLAGRMIAVAGYAALFFTLAAATLAAMAMMAGIRLCSASNRNRGD
ncbi:MAG TPA: MFS transporter [Geobacteraceae bacterium]|nr:MFS transporter [Geobacteraceae bacterium]